jgi:hypothetical protein
VLARVASSFFKRKYKKALTPDQRAKIENRRRIRQSDVAIVESSSIIGQYKKGMNPIAGETA